MGNRQRCCRDHKNHPPAPGKSVLVVGPPGVSVYKKQGCSPLAPQRIPHAARESPGPLVRDSRHLLHARRHPVTARLSLSGCQPLALLLLCLLRNLLTYFFYLLLQGH